MGPKVVALGLQEVGREPPAAVAIVKGLDYATTRFPEAAVLPPGNLNPPMVLSRLKPKCGGVVC
jgi:hypothetical protein